MEVKMIKTTCLTKSVLLYFFENLSIKFMILPSLRECTCCHVVTDSLCYPKHLYFEDRIIMGGMEVLVHCLTVTKAVTAYSNVCNKWNRWSAVVALFHIATDLWKRKRGSGGRLIELTNRRREGKPLTWERNVKRTELFSWIWRETYEKNHIIIWDDSSRIWEVLCERR